MMDLLVPFDPSPTTQHTAQSNRCALMAACTAGHHETADYLMSRGAKKVQVGQLRVSEYG